MPAMAKGLRNWGYKDVCCFLTTHGFHHQRYLRGSHERWKNDDGVFLVEVNRLSGGESYPPKTLENMIRQSGIPKSSWRKWSTTSNR